MGLQECYDAFRFSWNGGKLDNTRRQWNVWGPGEAHKPCLNCKTQKDGITYLENRSDTLETYCKPCYITKFEFRRT